MKLITSTIKARRAFKDRQTFLEYERARNAGCQMLQDAFDTFPTKGEACLALRQILESNQTAEQNHATANELARYADSQQRAASKRQERL